MMALESQSRIQPTTPKTSKLPAGLPPPGLEPPLGLEIAGGKTLNGGKGNSTAAGILLELVTIVAQISNLDKMLDTISGTKPSEESEAGRWHQVSMQALMLSRQALCEKQMGLLRSLSNVFEPANPGLQAGSNLPEAAPAALDFVERSLEACIETEKAESEVSTAAPEKDEAAFSSILSEGRRLSECTATTMLENDGTEQEGNGVPAGAPGAAAAEPAVNEDTVEGSLSLRHDLEKIKSYPDGRALICRRIKQLGFDSGELMREHFEQYGPVTEVLVAHSITKPSAKRTKGRVRPAAVGFVVMGSQEAVEAALAAGEQQSVKLLDASGEAVIEVGLFQPH